MSDSSHKYCCILLYNYILILHTQKRCIFCSLADMALSDVKVYFSFNSPYPDVSGLITSVKAQNLSILFVPKLYFIFPHLFSARNVYFSKSLYSLWSHGIHVKCCLQVPLGAHRTSTCFFLEKTNKTVGTRLLYTLSSEHWNSLHWLVLLGGHRKNLVERFW